MFRPSSGHHQVYIKITETYKELRTYMGSQWCSTARHVLQTTPLHSTRPPPEYSTPRPTDNTAPQHQAASTAPYNICKNSSSRTPVTTILCLFYNVTYNIEVYPHSANRTHTPFSLQTTQTPCSNINNVTDLPLRTLMFRWSTPSRHHIICYYINTWASSVDLISIGFILGIISYRVILYICNTTGIPRRCATPRMFLYL